MASKIEKPTFPVIENRNNIANSIFLHPVTRNELIDIISGLKNNTPPGPDKISVFLIKKFHTYFIEPICHILNLIFNVGKIPESFKDSITLPVFKTGDKKLVTNFRPITQINNFSKIFEKCLKNRVIQFCNNNNIFSKSQYGFLESRSTENAVFEIVNQINNCFQNQEKCITVFLDLAKAFDTVDHNILLQRLADIGVRCVALEIFEDYLTNRTQIVKVNESLSDPLLVTRGVPQGTVLGPILFLLYMNNIFKISNFKGEITSFADDTAITFVGKTWEEVYNQAEIGIKMIFNWLSTNLLSVNVKKPNSLHLLQLLETNRQETL
ncbi:hypothetical protein JTB14_020908 [Gonioctena quinquepunctata]|nr:hypothetical protein JTB14_020908 [Gonioctena quinquepunctata]